LIFDLKHHIFAKNIFTKLKKVRITPSLIKKLIESDQVLTFSYFIKLKYIYSNSTIYNFSLRKCANLIGVSPNAFKKHLDLMKKMGVVNIVKNKDGGENLTFLSIKKITELYGFKHSNRCGSLEFHPNDKIQNIKTILYSRVLINNINKQKYRIKGKSNSLMRKIDHLKKIGKDNNSIKRSIASGRIYNDTFICCQTIGDMLFKTKMTGYNQLMKMKNMGLLSATKKSIVVVSNCTKEDFINLSKFKQMTPGKYYYHFKSSSIIKNAGFNIEIPKKY